jgi:hypothetical protein
MLKLVSLAAAALVVASPAFSQNTAPAPQNANPDKPKPKIICETEEDIGSRLGRKRVCHTAEEWQRLRMETRDAIEKYQQQATGTPVSG